MHTIVLWLFLFIAVIKVLAGEADDRRLTAPIISMSEAEKSLVGAAVCGEGQYEISGAGVRCPVCPFFTSRAGANEVLEIGAMMRVRFPGREADDLLLDAEGCEAHSARNGAALLLGPKPTGDGLPQVAGYWEGVTPQTRYQMLYYKPGFRLYDCLRFDVEAGSMPLACNESDMAQGEVLGHLSVMEISREGVRRQPLFRWYDNRGTGAVKPTYVIPEQMERVLARGKRPETLKIGLRIKGPAFPQEITESLAFERKGLRFVADQKTQGALNRMAPLTRAVSD